MCAHVSDETDGGVYTCVMHASSEKSEQDVTLYGQSSLQQWLRQGGGIYGIYGSRSTQPFILPGSINEYRRRG